MPVDPIVAAAAISAATQGVQAFSTGRMNRKNRKFSEKMYNQQKADQLANWELQNKYNSPEQQMQRLKEAGLNPHLIYGGGGATQNAANLDNPSFDMPKQEAVNVTGLQDAAMAAVSQHLETKRVDASNKLIDAQILKVLSEVNTNEFDLSMKQRLADFQAQIIENQVKEGNQKLQLGNAQLEKLDTETRKLFQEISNETQRHQMDLLQRSNNLTKTTQEIINLRADEVTKKLQAQIQSGELTKQAYERETNRIEQMIKYAQQQAIHDSKKFDSPEDAMRYINTVLGIGATLIK